MARRTRRKAGSFKKSFVFISDDGTKLTITLESNKSVQLPITLRGPHDRVLTLALQGIGGNEGRADGGLNVAYDPQRAAIEKLIDSELERLSDEERNEISAASLVVTTDPTTAATQGPIVRFDCTWFGWD